MNRIRESSFSWGAFFTSTTPVVVAVVAIALYIVVAVYLNDPVFN